MTMKLRKAVFPVAGMGTRFLPATKANPKEMLPVAGIAMGLVQEGDEIAILTDIQGSEDHNGDMDFKVAGSGLGITALQMDIKIEGINAEIMKIALAQANEGRAYILGEMNKVLSEPRAEMSEFAPRLVTIKIHPYRSRHGSCPGES